MKETLDIVLTNTKMGERTCPPFNLCSLAGSNTNSQIDVRVLDSQLIGDNETLEWIKSINPKIVGITDSSPTHPSVIRMAKSIKDTNPDTLIVLGGKHPTLFPEEILEDDSIDFIVSGEGEDAWKLITESAQLNKSDKSKMKSDLTGKSGILFEGQSTKSLTPTIDLLKINSPNYNVLYPNLETYKRLFPNLEVDVERIRGCVGICPFCVQGNSTQRGIRVKNPQQVISEISFFQNNGFKRIFFTDDDIAVYPESAIEICNSVAGRDTGTKYSANVRADTFLIAEKRYEFSKHLKNANFIMLYVGLESGSETLQRYNRKIVKISKMTQMLEIANNHEIGVKLNLIIGLPYENKQTLEETMDYLVELRDKQLAFIPNIKYFLPYPGTKSYQDSIELGLVDPKKLDLATLESHSTAVMPTVGLSVAQLNKFYDEFSSKFYTPEYLSFIKATHPYLLTDINLKDHSRG